MEREFKPNSEPDGFRGIKWGTDIKTLSDMEYIEIQPMYGGIKVYKRKNDILKIGDAELEEIKYCFWRDKFFKVFILTIGYFNFLNLKSAVFEKFGEFEEENDEEYFWFGETAWVSLTYSKKDELGMLSMSSEKIFREMEKYKKQKAKEAAEKDF